PVPGSAAEVSAGACGPGRPTAALEVRGVLAVARADDWRASCGAGFADAMELAEAADAAEAAEAAVRADGAERADGADGADVPERADDAERAEPADRAGRVDGAGRAVAPSPGAGVIP
ncbi:MAG: hypothetical protein ACTH2N_10585, partial [Brachybacterium tyrofermentans]